MKVLFVHQNFPGQYKHLAAHLAADDRHEVRALGDLKNIRQRPKIEGVQLSGYAVPERRKSDSHPYLREFSGHIRRAKAAAAACERMKKKGFVPDVICVHPGWGEALFLKDVFPESRLLNFLEFFYHAQGADTGFDPEFSPGEVDAYRTRIRNSTLLLSLSAMDWGISPTYWQFRQHPEEYHPRMSVIHDGIDTRLVKPDAKASFRLPRRGLTFRPGDEVVTYVSRNLEPYRGFHTMMRALPELLRARPNAHVVLVGGQGASYGGKSKSGSYRKQFLEELKGRIDLNRIHFTGRLPYERYINLLQVSACHVYLTYPFVLSWSLLEAMSAGCAIVGSDTPPVSEVIRHGENGLLVDFFSPDALAAAVDRVLSKPQPLAQVRARARQTVVEHYDLETICLPRQLALIDDLTAGRLRPAVPDVI